MPQTTKKILVIEDEKPMRRALELKLTRCGFQVETAMSGTEAIKLLEKDIFDLILLDLILPGMDGFAVLSSIQQKNITAPVIVMSNLSQDEDVKRAKELGAKEFLIKSNIPIASLVDHVKNILGL